MRTPDWIRIGIWLLVAAFAIAAVLFMLNAPSKLENISEYEKQALAQPAREEAEKEAAEKYKQLTPQQIDVQFGPGAIGRLGAAINAGHGQRALSDRGVSFSNAIVAPTLGDFGLWRDYVPSDIVSLLPRGKLYRSGDPTQTLDTCMVFFIGDQVLWFHCKDEWLARAGHTSTDAVAKDFSRLFVEQHGIVNTNEGTTPTMAQSSQSVRIDGTWIRQWQDDRGTGGWKEITYDISLTKDRTKELLEDAKSASAS